MQRTDDTPFHRGEQLVQTRLGVRDAIAAWASRVVRPFMPDQHREFYARLPFVVAAARDAAGRPWATLLAGAPGFIGSPGPRALTLRAQPAAGDALAAALHAGTDVGLLGIDLAQRRRNRVNGFIESAAPADPADPADEAAVTLRFRVEQSFGNCPQYIVPRAWRILDRATLAPAVTRLQALDDAARRMIEQADTFFIASGWQGDEAAPGATTDERRAPSIGMDASHRGGAPGFVEVVDDRHIVFPDYAGNNHYNTIGNLVLDPRVGLTFVDFASGGLLQLTGRAAIDWQPLDPARHPGAQRLVAIEIDDVRRLTDVLPIRWSAPQTPDRILRIAERIRESADVSSFVLEARDGSPLPAFRPGQHLPLSFAVAGRRAPEVRTYSLSGPSGADQWRITVKREEQGLVSRLLHDDLGVDALVASRDPGGDFVLEAGERPVVLLSAGVGVTPMVSMLHALVAADRARPVHFIHGARDGDHHPLAAETRALIAAHGNAKLTVAYSRPRAEDRRGEHYQLAGRVDGALLARLPPDPQADWYLCGPPAFMADLVGDLLALGVDEARIHTETFGPGAAPPAA